MTPSDKSYRGRAIGSHGGDERYWSAEGIAELFGGTVELQRDLEKAIRLVVSVARGPDPDLRSEAIDRLDAIADELADSTARLSELIYGK